MALEPFLTADEHGKLPDGPLKSEYKLNEKDGLLYLDVKPKNGWALENVVGLKETVNDRTEKHRQATKQLDAWKTVLGPDITPEQAKAAIDAVAKLGDLSDKEKMNARIEAERTQMSTKYEQLLSTEKANSAGLLKEIQRVLVDSELARICAKPDVRGSFELLSGPVKSRTRVTRNDAGEFRVEVLDRNGNPAISQKPGNNGSMELEELVVGLRNDPVYQRAFEGTGSTGSGASGSGSSGSNGKTSKVDPKLPPEQRLAKLREQGATA